jgi:Ca-activated chloride channel family protein
MSFLNLCFPVLLAFMLFAPVTAVLAQQSATTQTAPVARTIKLNLIVTDASNHSLTDFKKEDLQLLEDDIPQTLTLFEKDSRPVRYVVAIDTSGSFKGLLVPVLEATKILINNNRDLDETMLIRFISSDKIETVEKFTSDKAKLVGSLRTLSIEGGQSAVVDALHLSVQAAAEYKAGDNSARRAVVLFSDGEDRASYYATDTLVKLLRAMDVQVFVVGIVTQLEGDRGMIRPSPKDKAEKLLRQVAAETGGRVFFPTTLPELADALTEIIKDLQTQFLVGYESTNQETKNNFRKVKAKIVVTAGTEKRSGITKSGYFLNPPDLDKKKKKSS